MLRVNQSTKADELEQAIMAQDRLILAATVQQVEPRFIWAAVATRNDLVRDLAIAWRVA